MKLGATTWLFFVSAAVLTWHQGNTQGCSDTPQYRSNCAGWKTSGYCWRTSDWYRFMTRHCRKTCGECPKIQTTKPSTAACVDNQLRSIYCGTWKKLNYCQRWNRFHGFMKKNCPKTCGFCRRITTPRPTTTKPPTTKAPTQSTCKDNPRYQQHCSGWLANGYCKAGSEWFSFMKDHCKQTCKFCGGPQPTTKVAADCGFVGKGGRVIGGVNAKPNYWKWQVALLDTGTFFCGGSLIHPRWVLTAAHCTIYRTAFIPSLEVVLGEHDRGKTEGHEVTIGVEKIINHPQYSRTDISNDIALVKLKSDAPLNNKIGLVCLPKAGQNVKVGKRCYISGWGKVEHPGSSVPILQQAKLPIVSKATCAAQNSKDGPKITDKMVCAGYGPSSKISGCHGDSGGPLVCENDNFRYVLEGAVSWGSNECDTKDKYTVFTRISEYIKWIEDNMKN